MRKIAALFCLPALAACATGPEAPRAEPLASPQAAESCNAAPLQEHLGHTASAASGATLLRLSGAGSLRWGPPDTMWTMDFRPDRLNVRYDRAMKIVEITCG